MEFEDFLEPEIAAVAAVTATIASPRARRLLRRGAVLGLAGILTAGDAVGTLVRGISSGAQQASETMHHTPDGSVEAVSSEETEHPQHATTQKRGGHRTEDHAE